MDYYSILGLSKECSKKEVKKAYRELALKFHPDVVSSDEGESKMKQINEAYSVLYDDTKRQSYDRFGQREVNRPQNNYNSIEEMMRRQVEKMRTAPRVGRNIHLETNVVLTDAIFGTELNVSLKIKDICKLCNASGLIGNAKCSSCSGQGACHRDITALIVVPKGTLNNQVLVNKNKGWYGLNSGPSGDIILTVNVVYPTNLTDEQEKVIKGFTYE